MQPCHDVPYLLVIIIVVVIAAELPTALTM
jgi:hypothetical protein